MMNGSVWKWGIHGHTLKENSVRKENSDSPGAPYVQRNPNVHEFYDDTWECMAPVFFHVSFTNHTYDTQEEEEGEVCHMIGLNILMKLDVWIDDS